MDKNPYPQDQCRILYHTRQNRTFTFETQNDNITPGAGISAGTFNPCAGSGVRGLLYANVMIYNMYPEEEIRCLYDDN